MHLGQRGAVQGVGHGLRGHGDELLTQHGVNEIPQDERDGSWPRCRHVAMVPHLVVRMVRGL